MKKIYYLLVAALLIAMPSCKKDNNTHSGEQGKQEEQKEEARVLENFENGGILQWTGADGCQFSIVDNPSKTGINTTAKVGQYITATNAWDVVWSTGFGAKDETFEFLDFDKEGYIIKVDVYAPVAGMPIYCKLEGVGGAPAKEITAVKTTKANEWETLEFDYEPMSVVNGAYKNFVFCVDAGGTTADTVVYLDNIRQVK